MINNNTTISSKVVLVRRVLIALAVIHAFYTLATSNRRQREQQPYESNDNAEHWIPIVSSNTTTMKLQNQTTCPPNMTYMGDRDKPPTITTKQSHSRCIIPNVLYQTGPSRCVATSLYKETISKWEDLYDSYRFYDDAAMDQILYHPRIKALFPTLPLALQCIEHANMPVMKADIWRYLILWQHGGIFADLDVKPNFANTTNGIFQPHDDGVFVLVKTGKASHVVSQWFMAVGQRHPMMHYAIQIAANSVLWAKRSLPLTHTGPQALYSATKEFLKGTNISERGLQVGKKYYNQQKQRSFVVLPQDVAHNQAAPSKEKSYEDMNMTHYWDTMKSYKYNNGQRCIEFLGGKRQPGVGDGDGHSFELHGTIYDLLLVVDPIA